MNRLRTICANLFWFALCLPAYFRFRGSLQNVQQCQTKKMLQLMRANEGTEYGRRHGFAHIREWTDFIALPITDYESYRSAIERIEGGEDHILTTDAVKILQPTSGTSTAPKLIPFTQSSAKEFQSAVDAWVADLFMQRPRMLLGRQYWSISPTTPPKASHDAAVLIGFLDDAEYFGKQRRRILQGVMAVPAVIRRITDMETNMYVTLLFLLRTRDLTLISVWHPSYLTILLNTMVTTWSRLLEDLEHGGIAAGTHLEPSLREHLNTQLLPAPDRAAELRLITPASKNLCNDVWPDLQVISCWCDGNVRTEVDELRERFPDVLIQGKGLLATEGVISIPMGSPQQHVCAITSHVLEFQDGAGIVHPAWGVKRGIKYQVILTTGAGLYRYQLRDQVEVTGFYGGNPCLRFIGRSGVVSDCVGEKLHLEHVETILADIAEQYFHEPRFAMLVPSAEGRLRRYNLLVEDASDPLNLCDVASVLETKLSANYYYAHARELGQLQKAAVTLIQRGARTRFRSKMIQGGALAGTVKFPALCTEAGVERCLIGAS